MRFEREIKGIVPWTLKKGYKENDVSRKRRFAQKVYLYLNMSLLCLVFHLYRISHHNRDPFGSHESNNRSRTNARFRARCVT